MCITYAWRARIKKNSTEYMQTERCAKHADCHISKDTCERDKKKEKGKIKEKKQMYKMYSFKSVYRFFKVFMVFKVF